MLEEILNNIDYSLISSKNLDKDYKIITPIYKGKYNHIEKAGHSKFVLIFDDLDYVIKIVYTGVDMCNRINTLYTYIGQLSDTFKSIFPSLIYVGTFNGLWFYIQPKCKSFEHKDSDYVSNIFMRTYDRDTLNLIKKISMSASGSIDYISPFNTGLLNNKPVIFDIL